MTAKCHAQSHELSMPYSCLSKSLSRSRRSAGDVLELVLHLHEEDGNRSDHGNLIRESDKSPPRSGRRCHAFSVISLK